MSYVFNKIYDTLMDLYNYSSRFPFCDIEKYKPSRFRWNKLSMNTSYYISGLFADIDFSIDGMDSTPSYNEFLAFMEEEIPSTINAPWAEQQYRLLDYLWSCGIIIDGTIGDSASPIFTTEYTLAEAKANSLIAYENAITSSYMNVSPIPPMMSRVRHTLNILEEHRYIVYYAGHYFEQPVQLKPNCTGKAFFRVTYRATDPDYSEYFPTIEGVPNTTYGEDNTSATVDLPEFDFTIQQCDDEFYIDGLQLPYIDLPTPSVEVGHHQTNIEKVTLIYKNLPKSEEE